MSPRLNRYARNWAFYLGFHHAYRREYGESQLVFNYARALTRFANSFTFSRGVHFTSAKEYEHIVPSLLKRVWEEHNDKAVVIDEIAENGSVSGDVFVKIAYDPPYVEGGRKMPGRVRIIPLNSSHCFPEWHPHDRERLLRFRLRYKFWATLEDGTRKVFTYQEVLDDEWIEEWVDDQIIDRRPNPLGRIPIASGPNIAVSGSPWGLSDLEDVIPLNQQYNATGMQIADIVAYHSAPVTVITGARAANLEKGANKVWGGLPPEAKVFNLENGIDLSGPIAWQATLKTAMHEMTGVPETALGQQQAISNTSGVALAIQFMPMTQKDNAKKRQYTVLFKKINHLVLLTLFTHEPETRLYDPTTEGIIQDGQPEVIDITDPLVYRTGCEWPPPLPVDTIIKLNEIQLKLSLGLESKRGALKSLGEEFPDEKLEELFEEQLKDAKQAGALALMNAQIQSAIVSMTGMTPDGEIPQTPLTGGTDSDSAAVTPAKVVGPSAIIDGAEEILNTELVTMAYGSKTPKRQTPENQT